MKTIITIFFFLFSISNISAQNYADKEYYLIDSLVLEDLSEFDSLLIEKHLKTYHADKTFHKLAHLDTVIELSDDDFVWQSYNKKYLEESKNILKQLDAGTEEWKEVNVHYANALGCKAFIFNYTNNLDSALFYYEKALSIFKLIELDQGIGEIMNAISTLYINMDRYFEAIDLANESFKYLDTNQISTAMCYSNYATFQRGQYNFEEALYFQNKANRISQNLNALEDLMMGTSNIATIKRYQGKIEEADSSILFSISIMNSLENIKPYYYIFIMEEHADILLEQNKIDSAKAIIDELIVIANSNNFYNMILSVKTTLAKIEFLKGNFKQSQSCALNVYKLGHENNRIDLITKSLETLILLAEHNKDYKLALQYQQELQGLEDERRENDNKKAILKQAIQYQFEKQKEIDDLKNEQKLEIAEQQKQKTRIGMFAAGIIALLIGLFSIYTFNRLKLIRNQKNKLDKAYVDLDAAYLKLEESTKNELAVSNLKALKAQMNPHFIFNLLNSIQGLVLRGDIDASYTYMTKFATLVRQTLNFSDVDLVDLEDEIDLLRIYLDLEKLRFSEDFEYHIIDNDIEDIKIPPLLIQPFIENSLVHGLLHKKGSKTLKIVFELKDQLICTITDNGVGRIKSKEIKARQDVQHESFSTQAIEKRFRILSETYKGQFGFKYEDVFEGDILVATQVKLHIPFKRIF